MKLPKLTYVSANNYIRNCGRGKAVLHLGCVGDHAYGLQDEWRESCLHIQLAKVATMLHGIDLNKDGIERLKRLVPPDEDTIKYIIGDVENLSETLNGRQYECVLAGSIIEHLSNPGKMLESIQAVISRSGDLVIVTPHSFGLPSFLRVAFRRKEAVNPDHTCYFSVSTLNELLRRYGFHAVEWHTGYGYHRSSFRWTLQAALGIPFFRLLPHLGGTLICRARL